MTTTKETARLETGVQELRELLRTLGHDPALINTHALQEIADQLSRLAGRPEGKGWGWKYLNQVLHNKLPASQALYAAILQQGAISDGVNATLATSARVMAYAPAGINVHQGSLILRPSRQCICGMWFIPPAWNSKDCSAECRKKRTQTERRAR